MAQNVTSAPSTKLQRQRNVRQILALREIRNTIEALQAQLDITPLQEGPIFAVQILPIAAATHFSSSEVADMRAGKMPQLTPVETPSPTTGANATVEQPPEAEPSRVVAFPTRQVDASELLVWTPEPEPEPA